MKAFDIFTTVKGKTKVLTIQAKNKKDAISQVKETITKVVDLGDVGEWGDVEEPVKPLLYMVSYPELKVGDVVHFYGARFEITETHMYSDTMVANGKWLDGETINGYFGHNKDWTFQGNKSARCAVEL